MSRRKIYTMNRLLSYASPKTLEDKLQYVKCLQAVYADEDSNTRTQRMNETDETIELLETIITR